MFDFDGFGQYYKVELDADVHRPPREINHEKLKKKKSWEPIGTPWKNEEERI